MWYKIYFRAKVHFFKHLVCVNIEKVVTSHNIRISWLACRVHSWRLRYSVITLA